MAWSSIRCGGIFGVLRRAAWMSADRARAVVPALVVVLLIIATPSQGDARALFTLAPSSAYRRPPLQDRRIGPIELRASTESADLIHIDIGLLRRCGTRDPGPNQRNLTFSNGRLECGKDHFRVGLISGTGHGTFVIHDGKVTGTIVRGEATFRVEPAGGMHALVKVDAASFPKEDDEPVLQHDEHRERRGSVLPKAGEAVRASALTEIDVLVAYTHSAAGAHADMLGLIHNAIADANKSYKNSDIKIRLNLVDSFQFQYTEGSKPFQQIVQDFARSPAANSRRDRSGADVSVLIVNGPGVCRPTDTGSRDLNCCGLGDALMATEATAFSVVHSECALAPNYSFAHEIGHLQGATHEVDGVLPAFRPYGHGFQHNSGRTRWRTIMAYDCPGHCQRLQYWSNPRIMHNGMPMGTDDVNDNARILNETAATVAAFRSRAKGRQPILP
jgi:hypothetical protein